MGYGMICNALVILLLAGCASHGVEKISPLENGQTVILDQQIKFPAVMAGDSEPQYNAIQPGSYRASARGLGGTFFDSLEKTIVIGGMASEKIQVENLTYGGVWLAEDKKLPLPVKIYYYAQDKRNISERSRPGNSTDGAAGIAMNQVILSPNMGSVVGGALGVAIVGALIDGRSVGMLRPAWQFVPIKFVEESAAKVFEVFAPAAYSETRQK